MSTFLIQPVRGYTIVEVLVAISVLMIAIVGPMTIAAKGLQNAQLARQQTTAQYLAQEGIELMLYLRDQNALEAIAASSDPWTSWTSLVTSECNGGLGCRIDYYPNTLTVARCTGDMCLMHQDTNMNSVNGGRFHSKGVNSSDTRTEFTRQVFATTTADYVQVRSRVSWNTPGGATKKVELMSTFANIYDF